MPLLANLLSASNGSSTDANSSMEVTDAPQKNWYSPTQPDMVSNTNLNSTIDDVDFTMPTLSDWLLYTYCGLVGFGIISNTLNLVVFARLKTSIMYIYLHWIALFELCFCVFLAPGIAMLRIGYTTSYVFAWLNFIIFQLMWFVASGASMLLTVVIGYDRIYHITSPLKARISMTKNRARILVAIVVLICIALRLPFILHLQIVSHTTLDGQVLYTGMMVGTSDTSFIVPVYLAACVFDYFSPISLAVCTVIILCCLRKIKNQRKQLLAVCITEGGSAVAGEQPSPIVQSHEEKLMLVLVTMSLTSITCNVPVTMLRLIWPATAKLFLVKNIANFLFITNHICNVFIYTATNKTYWDSLVTLLRPWKPNASTTPEQHNASTTPEQYNADRSATIQREEKTPNTI